MFNKDLFFAKRIRPAKKKVPMQGLSPTNSIKEAIPTYNQ